MARALGVTSVAARRWYPAWKTSGRRGLTAAGRASRRPAVTPAQLAEVDRALREGPRAHGFATELWTLPRVATVIHSGEGQVVAKGTPSTLCDDALIKRHLAV